MKLGELANYRLTPPVVQFRHEDWIRSDQPYSPEASAFVAAEMLKTDRDRRGSFSASSLNGCARQQQFTYIGLAQMPMSPQRMAVMHNGTFVHLRLQAAGLTEGWLLEAEVPIKDNATGLKGTMDGICYESSVFEAKSINDRAFRYIQDAPKDDHVTQVETYMVLSGAEKAVVLYENKNTQDLKEHVVHHDDAADHRVLRRALELQGKTVDKELFPMLPECMEGKGWRFDYCDYKDRCPLIQSFTHATKVAEQEQAA